MQVKVWLWSLIAGVLVSSAARAESDPAVLLAKNETKLVEQMLSDVQRRFERGEATEIELRNAFRPLYKLEPVALQHLTKWAESSPNSYVAHLALGIYWKRVGLDVRGDKFIQDTPKEKIAAMEVSLKKAAKELIASLPLTSKPFLNVFHLMSISMELGDRRSGEVLIKKANAMLPSNSLARDRYMKSLLPRWGGSYEEADLFIAQTSAAGVPPAVIWHLEAIKSDDMGDMLLRAGQHQQAYAHFEHALQLGAKAGGSFTTDYLSTSRYYVCKQTGTYCN